MLPASFWHQVEKTSTCWLWTGCVKDNGYGWKYGQYVHRLVYKDVYESIPEGYCIDHLCRVLLCVRPTHLEAVTVRENVRRGLSGDMRAVCKHGHQFVLSGRVKGNPDHRQRRCKVCQDIRNKKRTSRIVD